MPLSKHIDADDLMQKAADHPYLKLVQREGGKQSRKFHSGAHGGRYGTETLPKYTMPHKGISGDAAYQVITDELSLDGRPTLNLASFVHTWMPEQATKLMMENISVNLCDQDEYPATMAFHARCISMIADLWKAPRETNEKGERVPALGTATTGSSEAIMLGGLAMKKRWQAKCKEAGKSFKEPGPNVVFGSNAQVAIEKFARYFDVEERLVPISPESHYCLDPKKAIGMVDENTIGVIIILGSTYTGHFEPVEEMSKLLDDYEAKTGIDIPIHVDAASGGFVAPFVWPKFKWSFELPRVVSINSSGHKFGMAYVGIGWIIWRNQEMLPKELIFELHYLGSVEYSFNINFSRPAAPVLAQYFNFINLGFNGFRNVMQDDLRNARLLSRALEMSGYYNVLSDIHRPLPELSGSAAKAVTSAASAVGAFDEGDAGNYVKGLPVVAFRWTDEFQKKNPHLEQKWMQTLLRTKGWIVPNYALSPNLQTTEILRVVVRENLSEDMIDQLVHDILSITESLVNDSSAAHLASVTSQKNDDAGAGSGAGAGQNGESTEGTARSLMRSTTSQDNYYAKLDKGSGVRAQGYAKQC